jgi:hypothetical protein
VRGEQTNTRCRRPTMECPLNGVAVIVSAVVTSIAPPVIAGPAELLIVDC